MDEKPAQEQKLNTILGEELTNVLKAHAALCAASAGRAGAAMDDTLQGALSDADFLMRQYLACVRTFVEPVTLMCFRAVEAAQNAEAATEEPQKAKVQWPPADLKPADPKQE